MCAMSTSIIIVLSLYTIFGILFASEFVHFGGFLQPLSVVDTSGQHCQQSPQAPHWSWSTAKINSQSAQLEDKTTTTTTTPSHSNSATNNRSSVVSLPTGHSRKWDNVLSNPFFSPLPNSQQTDESLFAHDYSNDQLLSLATDDVPFLQQLDFVGLSIERLSSLAPTLFLPKCKHPSRWIDPPIPFRASYAALRNWGRMSKAQKEVELSKSDRVENAGLKRVAVAAADLGSVFQQQPPKRRRQALFDNTNNSTSCTTARRAMTRCATTVSTNSGGIDFCMDETPSQRQQQQQQEQQFSVGQQVYYQSTSRQGQATVMGIHVDDQLVPFYSIQFGERDIQTTGEYLSTKNPLQQQVEELVSNATQPQLQEVADLFVKHHCGPRCPGLTCAYLESMTKDPTNVRNGFCRVAADAKHQNATSLAHEQEWPVNSCLYDGCIDHPDQQVRMLLRNIPDCGSNESLHNRYSFISTKCTGSASANGGPCASCHDESDYLRRKCRDIGKWKEPQPSSNVAGQGSRYDTIHSPTQLRQEAKKTNDMNRQQRRAYKRKLDKLKKQIKNSKPQDLSDALKEQLGITHQSELYTDQLKNLWKEALKDETIEKKQLAMAMFDEHKIQADRARDFGRSACHYSGPFRSMIIQLKIRLGNGRFEFTSKALGLPALSTVNRWMREGNSTASDAANGGILYSNMKEMQDQFNSVYSPMLSWNDPRRLVSLAWDSTSIVDGLVISNKTNQVVGVAYDQEEAMNLFRASLESKADVFVDDDNDETVADDDEEEEDDDDNDDFRVATAKHFLVVIATTLDKNNAPITRTVARYGLKDMNADFLKRTMDNITRVMCTYGLIVAAAAMDGAVENRTWAKWKATHSVDDLVELGVLPAALKDNPLIPTSMNIAYLHPCFDPGELMFIVIHPDMPHLVKKIRNALWLSGLDDKERELYFRDNPLSLEMIRLVFEKSAPPRERKGAVRTSRLGTDHWDLNCNSLMRNYLAFQMASETVVEMIDDTLNDEEEIAEYKTLRDFLLLIDVLIDIMNAKQKGHDGIDTKDHGDLDHLIKCVEFVEEWRQEIENSDGELTASNFLPMTTYEDMVWMCLGTVTLANRYCESGVDFKIDLGRCGTDCCEYRFGNLKGRYTHRLTAANAAQGTHIADNINGCDFNMKACGNNSTAAISTSRFRMKM